MIAPRRRFLHLLGAGLAACARLGLRRDAPEPEDAGAPEPASDAGLPAAGGPVEEAPSLFSGAPAPDDPLELLYSRRVSFDEGQPLITVRIAEGRRTLSLHARGPLRVHARDARGASVLALDGGSEGAWTLALLDSVPGVGAAWVELEQIRFGDRGGLQKARELWESRGVRARVSTVGEAYGIAGHVVDTRRYTLLAEGDGTEPSARLQARKIEEQQGVRVQIHRELSVRPRGRIELRDAAGTVAAVGEGALELRGEPGIAVEDVEFGQGYSFHGFESRTYPGRLFATVDATGALALVAALPMERLVKGVVPSEIFPNAHPEALKAQAVTARGEVLAKIGARHLGDPYLLCAEQHCQVYKGIAAEERAPDAAVDATRGEALFSDRDGVSRLVDSVYSAVCGGYTEDNDAVWGGPPDPSLRGRPDFDPELPAMKPFRDGIGESLAARFVRLSPVPSYCALSGLARADKIRWRKTFTSAEVDAICAPLGVGTVRALAVEGRGVSGRARALRVEGSLATVRVHGELPIRRLFRNLNSSLFVLEQGPGAWTFVGGGWGHGSGMCQTGAIGRAQRGATYRDVLAWYYSGARPVKIY